MNIGNFLVIFGLAFSYLGFSKPVELIEWQKVEAYPHDSEAFTQGLVFSSDGTFKESTGVYGKSEIRTVDKKSGKVLNSTSLPKEFFGEGLAAVGKRWFQLTWQEGIALEWQYNQKSGWKEVKRFNYTGQGWGLASDGKFLFMSNGTSKIQVKDPKDFKTLRSIEVTAEGNPFDQLNELEYVDGFIYANRWMSSFVLKIDPKSGEVVGILNFESLVPHGLDKPGTDTVLNGIAWDSDKKLFYVTGKKWPVLYAIKVLHTKGTKTDMHK